MTPQETRAYLESRQSDAPKRFDLTCAPAPFPHQPVVGGEQR